MYSAEFLPESDKKEIERRKMLDEIAREREKTMLGEQPWQDGGDMLLGNIVRAILGPENFTKLYEDDEVKFFDGLERFRDAIDSYLDNE